MKPVLITGGAGFIGVNLAHRLLASGQPVLVLDSLARPGVERNLRWLREVYGEGVQIEVADIRDASAVRRAVAAAGQVFHFAAQVAVTTSLDNPLRDFEINACGTLNVLEAIRRCGFHAPLLVTSTNKVYGALDDVELRKQGQRYVPVSEDLRRAGIGESRSLDFHSPYGCSKGTADQYVLDYTRSYGLHALVFRMSCIYGPHQFGNEDQGWVAHFLIRAREELPIVIYGDGCQVRDVLYVGDLMDAMALAMANMHRLSGRAFNMGGGPGNTLSLLELIQLISQRLGKQVALDHGPWRQGDQRYYVTDTSQFEAATGWRARTAPGTGLGHLQDWLDRTAALEAEKSMPAGESRPAEALRT
jgi:CDP-paratose 2-epimerase